jgi:hypothetical protein
VESVGHLPHRVLEGSGLIDQQRVGVVGGRDHVVELPADAPWRRGHDPHPVAQEDRLGDRVGDDEHRGLDLLPQPHDEPLHVEAGRLVEGGEGLVHEDDAGLEHQRAGDGHALLLAPGQLVRVLVLVARKPHPDDPLSRQLLHLPPRQSQLTPVELKAEGDVLEHRQVGEGAIALEDHPAVATRAHHPLAAHQHLAAGRRIDVRKALDQVQDRRLATAGGADEGDELAVVRQVVDPEGHVADRRVGLGGAGAVGLLDAEELDHRRAGEVRRRAARPLRRRRGGARGAHRSLPS